MTTAYRTLQTQLSVSELVQARTLSLPAAFLDLNIALAPEGELLPELTVDGLHLSGRGYSLWRDALLPALAECLR